MFVLLVCGLACVIVWCVVCDVLCLLCVVVVCARGFGLMCLCVVCDVLCDGVWFVCGLCKCICVCCL